MSGGERLRVAFVVQRYHADIGGGAERHCGLVAAHLANHWDVEILTTCARDYRTWADALPEGLDTAGDVPVRRFRVDQPRDIAAFDRLSGRVLDGPHDADAEQRWIDAQGPQCSRLLDYIRAHRDDYDLFAFFTYLYWTTVHGLPAVADKAWLVPTAHDEKPIYLRCYDEVFRQPQAILYNTEWERDFCRRRFAQRAVVEAVVGCGVEEVLEVDFAGWNARRASLGIGDEYLLYVGRITPAKGCDALAASFIRLFAEAPDLPPLVLVGPASMPLPRHPKIIAAGYLDEPVKSAAIAGAMLVVQPSPHESLSLVLLEAWQQGRAVQVNGRCEVLRRQVIAAGGGLYYTSDAELRACLVRMLSRPAERAAFGASGRSFVQRRYAWSRIVEAYLSLAAETRGVAARP